MKMKHLLAGTCALLAAGACGGETVAPPAPQPPVAAPSSRAPAPCSEGEPCWDCITMGDRICGPAKVTAHQGCLIAANTYKFTHAVCESLVPGWSPPPVTGTLRHGEVRTSIGRVVRVENTALGRCLFLRYTELGWPAVPEDLTDGERFCIS